MTVKEYVNVYIMIDGTGSDIIKLDLKSVL